MIINQVNMLINFILIYKKYQYNGYYSKDFQ